MERASYFHLVNPSVGCQEPKMEAEASWLKYGFVHLGSSPSSGTRRRCVSAEPRPSSEAEDIAFIRYVATFHFGGANSFTGPTSSSSGRQSRSNSPRHGVEPGGTAEQRPAQHGDFRTLGAGAKSSGMAAAPCSPSSLRADAPVFIPPVFAPQTAACHALLSAPPASISIPSTLGAGAHLLERLSLPPPPLAPAPSPAPVISSPPPWWVCLEVPSAPQLDVPQMEATFTTPAHRAVGPCRHLQTSDSRAEHIMATPVTQDQAAEAPKLMHAILGSGRVSYDDTAECATPMSSAVSLASRGSSSSTMAPSSVGEDVELPLSPPSPPSRPGSAVVMATKRGQWGQTNPQRDLAFGASTSRSQANGHGRTHRKKGINNNGAPTTGLRVWRPKSIN